MKPFSEEIIKEARNVNLVAYLKAMNVPLIKDGKEYRLKEHDSLVINPSTNLWIWNSRDVGGKNAIDFLMTVEKMKFSDAVYTLMGKASELPECNEHIENEKKEFNLPPPAANNRRVFAYLRRERSIVPPVINHFIKVKDLYEDGKFHNAVFVGRDEQGKARFAFKRSTSTFVKIKNGKKVYRWDVKGSDKSYGFKYAGTSDVLYVFESAIDMLSYISLREILHPGTWKTDSYLSLDGVAKDALWGFLGSHAGKAVRHIVFCLDSDKGGRKASVSLTSQIAGQFGNRYETEINLPHEKDYNDVLKNAVKSGALITKYFKEDVSWTKS